MTPEVVNSISDRYLELYKNITGKNLEKSDKDIEDRLLNNIETNLSIKSK